MISTNIDGTSGSSNQLFDLLTVVANPASYQEKLKALEDATAENKKYVELVGPASDVLALRDKARDDAAKAAQALKDAENKASEIVAGAEARANVIVSTAQEQAEAVREQAQEVLSEARSFKVQVDKASAQAEQIQSRAEAAIASAQAKSEKLDKALADAQEAKEEFVNAREDLIAKHKAFIASL